MNRGLHDISRVRQIWFADDLQSSDPDLGSAYDGVEHLDVGLSETTVGLVVTEGVGTVQQEQRDWY